MPIVFRIEHKKCGLGPWAAANNGHIEKLPHKYFDGRLRLGKIIPVPLEDFDNPSEEYYFGFKSLKQCLETLSKARCKTAIKRAGFVIRMYKAEIIHSKSGSQVAFLKDKAKLVGTKKF